MHKFLFLICFFLPGIAFSQYANFDYFSAVKPADSLYKAKNYPEAAKAYSKAFGLNKGKGSFDDRYKAACAWNMAGNSDSAFAQLAKIAPYNGRFGNYSKVLKEKKLESLHNDPRWDATLQLAKASNPKIEKNKEVITQLKPVLKKDQKIRRKCIAIEKKHGWDAEVTKACWKSTIKTDKENLAIVSGIIDKYGWLGPKEIGKKGNMTLFLVIQHSDSVNWEKYLPIIKEAAKAGKAYHWDVALMEDRLLLEKSEKQIYGSQLMYDLDTKQYRVQPLIDPKNVDARRMQVGLPPMSKYLKIWGIEWNPNDYTEQPILRD